MYRFARRFVEESADAEDVVQELMMKFWQIREQLANSENLKTYVFRAVKNECLNRLKHRSVRLAFMDSHKHRDEAYYPESNNLKEEIIKFINALPEKQKVVIHLRDVEEYDIDEISEILEIDANAVRVNLMRARKKVKEKINQLIRYEERAFTR